MDLVKKVINFIVRPTNARTVLTLLILTAAVPVTVYVAQQQQETRQRAVETEGKWAPIGQSCAQYCGSNSCIAYDIIGGGRIPGTSCGTTPRTFTCDENIPFLDAENGDQACCACDSPAPPAATATPAQPQPTETAVNPCNDNTLPRCSSLTGKFQPGKCTDSCKKCIGDASNNGNQVMCHTSTFGDQPAATATPKPTAAPASTACPAPAPGLTVGLSANPSFVSMSISNPIAGATYRYEWCRSFNPFDHIDCFSVTTPNSTGLAGGIHGDSSASGYKFRARIENTSSCTQPSGWSSTQTSSPSSSSTGTGGAGGAGLLICPFGEGGTCANHSAQDDWQDLGPSSSCGGKNCFKRIPPVPTLATSNICGPSDCSQLCAPGFACLQIPGVKTKSCECRSSIEPTATPRIPAPTPTPLPGSTQLALILTQQGLFSTPVNRTREVTVVLEGPDGKTTTKTGKVTYSTGAFVGTINLGVLPTGSYDLEVKSGNFLKGFVDDFAISGTAVSAQALLAVGLDDQANIAAIPVLYAAGGLKECFGSTLGIKKCTTPEDVDLDGNGDVDRIDYNIYFKGITNLSQGLPVQ